MKVFVVTAGEYSDYHIEKIFTDRIKAHLYSLMGREYEHRQVEEYELDEIDVDVQSRYLRIVYDYNRNRIEEVLIHECEIKPRRVLDDWYRIEFTIPLTNEKVYKNVCRYGKDSGLIKRITEDTFAKYLYENDLSREELIQKEHDRINHNAVKHQYVFYTTSAVTQTISNSESRQKLITFEDVVDLLVEVKKNENQDT